MVRLSVTLAVVMLVLQEVMLVGAVRNERRRADAEPGERALEAVPPGEDALISPCLAIFRRVSFLSLEIRPWEEQPLQAGEGGIAGVLLTISPTGRTAVSLPQRQTF